MVWHGPQRGYGPDGMSLQAPAGHPDPIYAGFRSRPEERGPRGRPGHHRGGERGAGVATAWEDCWPNPN